MTVPSTVQLQIARTQAERLLRDSVTVSVRTETVSASGSATITYAAPGSAIPALIFMATSGRTINSEYTIQGESKQKLGSHVIRLKHDADVNVGDRIINGSTTYQVVAVASTDTNALLLQVGAVRV